VVERRHVLSNWWALAAVALVVSLQMVAIYVPPIAAVLQVVPLTVEEWGIVIATALVPAVVGQILKIARSRARQSHGTL
jgi:Ca2+-transporting ATPase